MQLSKSKVTSGVSDAFRNWNNLSDLPSADLRELHIVREQVGPLKTDISAIAWRKVLNRLLLELVAEIEELDQEAAWLLRARFVEGKTLNDVAREASVSVETISRRQRAALEGVGRYLYDWEVSFRRHRLQQLESQLPRFRFSNLIGRETDEERVVEQVLSDKNHQVIVVSGLGGIGTTAFVHSVARKALASLRFGQCLWIGLEGETNADAVWKQIEDRVTAAKASDTPDLSFEDCLASERFLVVLDDLGAQTEREHVLERLINVKTESRFLVTTRYRPPSALDCMHVKLSDLDTKSSEVVLRQMASERGTALDQETEPAIRSLLQAIGGHPLSLWTTAGMAQTMTIPEIMRALKAANTHAVKRLYEHVIGNVWSELSANSRHLLKTLAVVEEQSANSDMLREASGLADGDFWRALEELSSLGLIETETEASIRSFRMPRIVSTILTSGALPRSSAE